ncbi:MAG TPA: hypothetical protein DCM28_01895 [Phycisphaerales bacterium]|nr:hypothetical protein [Phycisphaerales bacterium]|tara:strand:+ start:316 stop:975 length:660 start_codon:yes stop_codon:yes gene_type:complete
MSDSPGPLSEILQCFEQGYRKSRQTQQLLSELFPKFEWVVVLISLPWLVILHYRVGRRIVSPLNLSCAGGVLMMLCLWLKEDWCVVLVAVVFVVGLIQYFKAITRHDIHSLMTGIPWIAHLHPAINRPMIVITIESLFLLLAGQVIEYCWGAGIILQMQATCLFLGQLFASLRKLRTTIDQNDQQIQAEENARKSAKLRTPPTIFHQAQSPHIKQKPKP